MSESQIFLFILTSLVIIITPGQDLVLVLSRGVSQGSRAGLATAAGVSAGLLGHTLFATLGLGTLLLASEIVFTVIKYIGAAYLVYLGVNLMLTRVNMNHSAAHKRSSLRRYFSTGAFSNISNPKITLFYFAYLPQFISSGGEQTIMIGILGALFALLTFLVKAPIGYFGGRFSQWLIHNGSVLKWFNRSSGLILVALGVKLALERR